MTDETRWHDVLELTIEGKAWEDTAAPFDRLPARAEGLVREPVWNLSRHAAGICARFETDARQIQARWTLRASALAMPHMPATGVSGLDLYRRDAEGAWRWLGYGRPEQAPTNTVQLAGGMPAEMAEHLLYLPLYNGVTSVEISVPEEATLRPGPPRPPARRGPLVFYGTSITQGGCASRPGMAHVALLGRWLDRPVINLGFSGNGTMDAEVAQLLAELEVAAFVIDCLPNMGADIIEARAVDLIRTLRSAQPATPIVMVEDRTNSSAALLPSQQQAHRTRRAALRAAYDTCANGDANLYYQEGADLLGSDGEGTVDGSHPTDLGFLRQAQCMLPLLEQILGPHDSAG